MSNSRSPETLAELAAETGATAVWAKDAAADADLVVREHSPEERPDLADGIIDARKPSARNRRTSWVAEQIGAPVYKAGEDGPGRELVHDIVEQLGFEPVYAGPISESWRQQPGTPVYGKDFDAEKTRKALAEATPERTPEFTARG